MLTRLRPLGGLALLVAYPLLVHAAVVSTSAWLTFTALVTLVLNIVWPRLSHLNTLAVVILCVGLCSAAVAAWLSTGRALFYAAPMLILAMLLNFFATSLRRDRTPLATRAAEAVRGTCSASIRRYTRAVTVFWCGVFVALLVENMALIFCASAATWSLFANGLNYIVVVAAFVGELLCRRLVLTEVARRGLWGECRLMAQLDWPGLIRHRG